MQAKMRIAQNSTSRTKLGSGGRPWHRKPCCLYRVGNDEPIRGRYQNTIVRPSIKLAVIRSHGEVAIVPWSSALERYRGREIVGRLRDKSIELALGRSRGL